MSAATLPAAADFTGAAVTEAQFKTALTSLHDFVAELQTKAADIASAGTCDIGTSAGNYVKITGTTTITAFGTPTAAANTTRVVLFGGALTLTHNATSLILPGAANITTAAGDVAMFVHEGSGNWRCLLFFPQQEYFKPIRGAITLTATGMTTSPTGTVDYELIGKNVTFSLRGSISGTSNSTSFGLTGLPSSLRPISNIRTIKIRIADNGVIDNGILEIYPDGTMIIYKGLGAGAFTASGTKTFYTDTFSYIL